MNRDKGCFKCGNLIWVDYEETDGFISPFSGYDCKIKEVEGNDRFPFSRTCRHLITKELNHA